MIFSRGVAIDEKFMQDVSTSGRSSNRRTQLRGQGASEVLLQSNAGRTHHTMTHEKSRNALISNRQGDFHYIQGSRFQTASFQCPAFVPLSKKILVVPEEVNPVLLIDWPYILFSE